METDKEIIIKKYLREYEPYTSDAHGLKGYEVKRLCGEANPLEAKVKSGESRAESGEFSGRVVVKTSEDIIRELADIVEMEINDVVAVMLAEGYDLLRRNEVYGWAMRGNGEHCV